MKAHRLAFEAALRLFARVSEAMKRRGFEAPVLVGGAVVELYTGSMIATGDFDISTGRQSEFEEELRAAGFVRPSGPGMATRGWIHPDLRLGFEVVSGTLLDGMADRDRVLLFDMDADGLAAILSVEDIIADRVGQYVSGTASEMLEQARLLFSLSNGLDFEYLERRVRYESGGDHGLDILRA